MHCMQQTDENKMKIVADSIKEYAGKFATSKNDLAEFTDKLLNKYNISAEALARYQENVLLSDLSDSAPKIPSSPNINGAADNATKAADTIGKSASQESLVAKAAQASTAAASTNTTTTTTSTPQTLKTSNETTTTVTAVDSSNHSTSSGRNESQKIENEWLKYLKNNPKKIVAAAVIIPLTIWTLHTGYNTYKNLSEKKEFKKLSFAEKSLLLMQKTPKNMLEQVKRAGCLTKKKLGLA
jgi:hypothetical protein